MDKRHFEQLVKGVQEMRRHISGKVVRGARDGAGRTRHSRDSRGGED